MKRYLLLFFAISLTVLSCHYPSYTFNRTSSRYFKFPKGKYLLNTIEAPEAVRPDMQEMIFDDFNKYTGENNLITLQNATVNILIRCLEKV